MFIKMYKITLKKSEPELESAKNSKIGCCSRGGVSEGEADHCTSNIADITVMLPSRLLYFPISGKLYLISALPQPLFGRLLK